MTSLNWYDSAERFRSQPAPFAGALQEYYTNIFRERSRQRKNLIDKITTAEQAADYVKNIRSAIKSRFRFPEVKTPLDAQTVYRRDLGDHIIEGVTFFSRPGVAVSGLFAAPAAPGPHPAVLFLCGHSAGGKFLFFHLLFWVYKIILFTVCQRWHIFPGFFYDYSQRTFRTLRFVSPHSRPRLERFRIWFPKPIGNGYWLWLPSRTIRPIWRRGICGSNAKNLWVSFSINILSAPMPASSMKSITSWLLPVTGRSRAVRMIRKMPL